MKSLFFALPLTLLAATANAYAVDEAAPTPTLIQAEILSQPISSTADETCEITVTPDVIAALALPADWRAAPAEGVETAVVCAE
ncbi:MAG: hypothetical protein AAFU41_12280 [Pseudomonadota bacterium]